MSDIVLSAIGHYGLISSDWIKKDAVVIDISTNFLRIDGQEKMVGDINFHEVKIEVGF